MKKITKLEKEAKEYQNKLKKESNKKTSNTLTARRYFAGQAMSSLINISPNHDRADIKREAYKWADYMIEDN